MAYYYVKNGGTATGDGGRYASQQTGTFAALGASGYYNDIVDAINNSTTSPASGDFINVSDLHTYTQTVSTYNGLVPPPYFVVCVDDANVDAGRTSSNRASEDFGATSTDVTMNDQFWSGIEFSPGDDISFTGGNVFIDCHINCANTSTQMSVGLDGSSFSMIMGEITTAGTAFDFGISGGCTLILKNVTLNSSIANLIDGTGASGGSNALISGCDLTNVTGTLANAIGGNATADDSVDIRFDMCKIAGGVSFVSDTMKSLDQVMLFTRCSDSSDAAEYQYFLTRFGGTVEDDSTIRRGDDPTFEDSGTAISYEIITNADASLGSPLHFDFPNPRWAALSAGATDTLRFYVASTATLTDKDIYVDICYPDGTNKQTPNFFSSSPNTVGGVLDLMAAGSTLTTDSGSDWRDGAGALAGHNEYQIDVTTTGDVGADTVPIVRVYVTKASTTIQLASIYDLN